MSDEMTATVYVPSDGRNSWLAGIDFKERDKPFGQMINFVEEYKYNELKQKLEKAITFIDGCIEKAYDLPPEKRMFNSIKHKESRVSLQARQILKELKGQSNE